MEKSPYIKLVMVKKKKPSKSPRRSLERSILDSQVDLFLPHYVIGTIDLGDQSLNSFFILCYTGPPMKWSVNIK